MKSGLLIFLGALGVAVISWSGVVLMAQRQYGALTQFKDPAEEALYPLPLSGIAAQGAMVYKDLGCASCHTQQVRRAGIGGDIERGWGTRQSVARDYIRETTAQLGSIRVGPDLRNLADRSYATDEYLFNLLYAPESVASHAAMPAYRFLFEVRPITVGQASPSALHLTGKNAPPAGCEVVPSIRAQRLVAYLRSLNDTYEYPEAKPFDEKSEDAKKKDAH